MEKVAIKKGGEREGEHVEAFCVSRRSQDMQEPSGRNFENDDHAGGDAERGLLCSLAMRITG